MDIDLNNLTEILLESVMLNQFGLKSKCTGSAMPKFQRLVLRLNEGRPTFDAEIIGIPLHFFNLRSFFCLFFDVPFIFIFFA